MYKICLKISVLPKSLAGGNFGCPSYSPSFTKKEEEKKKQRKLEVYEHYITASKIGFKNLFSEHANQHYFIHIFLN